ncbi:hypothetical protein IPM19_03080 [bacterium]|nr:MAG: hypothetical protein IPM19_03080 [bacterium]
MEQLFYDTAYYFPSLLGIFLILLTIGSVFLIIYLGIGVMNIPDIIRIRRSRKSKRPH